MTNTRASIPTFVIAGYLGAGKTTLINSILQKSHEPIAVVVNDFGAVNIDATLVRSYSDNVWELTNGCICCSIGESLADVLFSLLERQQTLSYILIEASGVADPRQVAGYTYLDGLYNAGTIVLVDAIHCFATVTDKRVSNTFQRQLEAADLLVLTKTDIASADQRNRARQLLKDTQPQIPIIEASADLLSQVVIVNDSETKETLEANFSQHDSFHTVHIPARIFSDEQDLADLIAHSARNVVRAKGIVEMANGERRVIHKVGDHFMHSPTTGEPTGIVVIYTD